MNFEEFSKQLLALLSGVCVRCKNLKLIDHLPETDTRLPLSQNLTRGIKICFEKNKICLDGCDYYYNRQLWLVWCHAETAYDVPITCAVQSTCSSHFFHYPLHLFVCRRQIVDNTREVEFCTRCGGNAWWFNRFLAQHIAVFYYFMTVFMYALSPRMTYHFSECVENHAYETYNKFIKIQGEELKKLPAPVVAVRNYTEGDLYLFVCRMNQEPILQPISI